MDISQLEISSPGPVLETVSDEVLARTTVAVYGKAKHLARLSSAPNLQQLWISGVNAAAVNLVGSLTALERLVIHDFRISDLHSLAQLENLAELTIAGSPKLRSLAGVERLLGLRRLILFDNCNYSDVDGLAGLADLDTLCLEGGFSKKLVLPNLRPLGHLLKLRRLRLASLTVNDGLLRPLHTLRSLKEVFIAKAFAPAEFHALAAALPDARGEFLDSFRIAG